MICPITVTVGLTVASKFGATAGCNVPVVVSQGKPTFSVPPLQSPASMRTIIFDNGGSRLRGGFAGDSSPRVDVPNAAARIRRSLRLLVADEVETGVKDASALHFFRPLERGQLTDTGCEALVWSRALRSAALLGSSGSASDAALLLSHAALAPPRVLASTDELVFETMGFSAYARAPAPALALGALRGADCGLAMPASGAGVVVDMGWSASTVAPVLDWALQLKALRRVDVGGRLLTNALKEALSFRQLNLMDDTLLVERVKAALCASFPRTRAPHSPFFTAEHRPFPCRQSHRPLPDICDPPPPPPLYAVLSFIRLRRARFQNGALSRVSSCETGRSHARVCCSCVTRAERGGGGVEVARSDTGRLRRRR